MREKRKKRGLGKGGAEVSRRGIGWMRGGGEKKSHNFLLFLGEEGSVYETKAEKTERSGGRDVIVRRAGMV